MARGAVLVWCVITDLAKFGLAVETNIEAQLLAFDLGRLLEFSKMRGTLGDHELAITLRQEIDAFVIAKTAHQIHRIRLALIKMACFLETETLDL